MSALRIEILVECLYEHDRFATDRGPRWALASTRKQAEYRGRAEAVEPVLRRPETIASAPTDGTVIITLTWLDDGWVEIAPARFERDERVLCGGSPAWIHDEHGGIVEPTHWFPLPEAPERAS